MPNEYEQPVEPMSRTEDLLRTGTEEPVIAMSEIEKILRGEHIDRPHSRVADLLLQYNPSDILIEKRIEENGTYYATADAADGYYKVVVDTPVIPPTVLEHLVETISTNGSHTFTPGTGVDGFSDASITVSVAPNVGSKSITQNGNYAASSDNLDGYSNVNVNVQPNTMEKSISANGTYIAANDNVDGYSKAIVNVPPEPITEDRTVENLPQPIASFNNGAEAPLTSLKVAIEPVQDLHGYDAPWVGGAGKNKFDVSTYVSGNSNFTKSGETFSNSITDTKTNFEMNAFSVDNNDNLTFIASDVISSTGQKVYSFSISSESKIWIKHNGATQDLWLRFGQKLSTGSYKLIFNVGAYNPSTTNRLKISNIMVVASTETNYTFAPYSNICPISGWDEVDVSVSGVNVWDEEWEVGDIDAQGNPTSSSTLIRIKNYNPCKPNTTYKVVIPNNVSMYMKYYDKDKNFITPTVSASSTITTPSNCYYFKFVIGSTYGTTYNNDISINYPSTDTSYHAYNGQTYTIDLDGTRYGGEVDVVNGGGTETYAKIALADIPKSKYGSYQYGIRTIVSFFDAIPNASLMTGKSNTFVLSISGESYNVDKCSIVFASGSAKTSILISTQASGLSADASVQEIDSWLRSIDAYFVYPLATPTTYSTQPTPINSLKGDNNLMANTGDINDLDYIYVNAEVGTLINKSITANGSYCAVTDDNADGYLNIDVNLPDGTNTEY